MGQNTAQELARLEALLDGELHEVAVAKALEHLGAPGFPRKLLTEARVFGDYLPRAEELQPTGRQRALHFLWDAFDRLPVSALADFAVPFRRLIAERLFGRCGTDFIAADGVRFTFGQLLGVGDGVYLAHGVSLDTQGGVALGDGVYLGERVTVSTTTHSEADHSLRTYAPVVVEPYARVADGALLFPGVTVGTEAVVQPWSLVDRDVPPGTVVAGAPAEPVRERAAEGRHGPQLQRDWLARAAFQHGNGG